MINDTPNSTEQSKTWFFALLVIAVLFDIIFMIIASFIGSWSDHLINFIFIFLGIGLSIPAGMMISPANSTEVIRFESIQKALATFVSGYLLAKLDGAVTALLAPDQLSTQVIEFRLVAFLVCFAVGVTTVYAARVYLPWTTTPTQSGTSA